MGHSNISERNEMAVATAGPSRREQILHAAAELFATRGYHGVSVDEIGAAVGISGPGLYRHFRGKEAMLSELLVGISQRLLEGGRSRASHADSPSEALDALLRGHIDFALDDRDLIILQDRDLDSLPDADRHLVRRLQREYVEIWIKVVARAYPGFAGADNQTPTRASVHAVFGLLNSTPYSAAAHRTTPSPTREAMAELLRVLALGAFSAAAERLTAQP
jgi:AcrR family transcriptional regulator